MTHPTLGSRHFHARFVAINREWDASKKFDPWTRPTKLETTFCTTTWITPQVSNRVPFSIVTATGHSENGLPVQHEWSTLVSLCITLCLPLLCWTPTQALLHLSGTLFWQCLCHSCHWCWCYGWLQHNWMEQNVWQLYIYPVQWWRRRLPTLLLLLSSHKATLKRV